MTPLLRVLVAMPSLGRASSRKMSAVVAESSQAIAHPTTPPPMITTLVWSISFSGAAEREEILCAFHRFFDTLQELLQIGIAIDEVDIRSVHDEQIRR